MLILACEEIQHCAFSISQKPS